MRNYRGLTKDGKWVYGWYVNNPHGNTHIIIEPIDYAVEDRHDVIPETVGQQIGLPDKNGVEIYESDKITNGDKNIKFSTKYVVEWIDCGFRARQIGTKSSIGLEYWKDSIEVIGNIHQEVKI